MRGEKERIHERTVALKATVDHRSFPRSAWECLNGRSAFGLEWDAERPWLHSHAERGNDHLAGSDREMDTEGIHAVITAHKHIPSVHQRNGLDVFDYQNANGPPQSVVASAG